MSTDSASSSQATESRGMREHGVVIMLDGEDLSLPSRDVTPNQILGIAGLDSATHYIVLVQGRHQVSYQGTGDEQIRVHPNEMFISLSTGPTPTS